VQTTPTANIMPSKTLIMTATQTVPPASTQLSNPSVTAVPTLTPIPTSEPRPHLQLVFKYASDKHGAVYTLPFDLGCPPSAAPCIGKPELLFEYGKMISALLWSPDGTKAVIAALDENSGWDDIFLIDAKGQLVKQLTQTTTFEGGPTWLPDGKHISYVGCADGRCNYVKVDLNGNNPFLMLDTDYLTVNTISWFPDGNKVAFSGAISEPFSGIFVANPDGSELIRLTDPKNYNQYTPTISPDGKLIAFIRYNDPGDERADIILVHPDGSGEINLTKGKTTILRNLAWSPLEDWIAYNSCSDYGRCELFIIKSDGTLNINLSQGAEWELLGWRLIWAP